MTGAEDAASNARFGKIYRVRRFRLILGLCLFDAAAPVLNILQVLGVSLLHLVNVIQPLVFVAIVALTRNLSARLVLLLLLLLGLLLISLAKMFVVSGVDSYNFNYNSVGPYFYSLFVPFLISISIMSQKETDIDTVWRDLHWFSKWYLVIVAPVVVAYAVVHLAGYFSYFGFGVNFHYFAPFFFSRYVYVLGVMALILLSGKRAVLVGFAVQFGFYLLGRAKRSPVSVFLFVLAALLIFVVGQEVVATLLRRFSLMYEVFDEVDWGRGLLAMANSYQALVLFGGRLEEVTGVIQYFSNHPDHIWLGAPPGANYVWRVELSGFETAKSFAHLTWLGYVFRYGIIPTGLLIFYLFYLLLRRANAQNPLWLVYIGILTSATFGANLFYSPTAWVLIALYVRYGNAVGQHARIGFLKSRGKIC